MASSPITSWQIEREKVEAVTDFIFLGCKITANGDCSHEIKRHLVLERKTMTNLDSILKSKDITLPTKFHIVKAIVFPIVMYGCQSWTIKKAEWAPKNWCFRSAVWENTIESPINSKEIKPVNPKINQPWIFIERSGAKVEAPILWPPHAKSQLWKRSWCWERLKARERDNTGRDGWMTSPTQWTWFWTNSGR